MNPALQRQLNQRLAEAIEWTAFKYPLISKQELNVIRILSKCYSHQMIADELNISIDTVNTHLKNIRFKLGFNRDTQIVSWYIYRKFGLIDFILAIFYLFEKFINQ